MSADMVAELDRMVTIAQDGGKAYPAPTRASVMRDILDSEIRRRAAAAKRSEAA